MEPPPSLNTNSTEVLSAPSNRKVRASEKDTEEFPEGGRGWVVVAGTFVIMGTSFGMASAFGEYQKYYLEKFPDTKQSILTLIGSLQPFLIYFFAIPSTLFIKKVGPQVAVATSGLILVFSLMMTSLCNSVWQFAIAQGVIFGIGSSLSVFVSYTVPQQWFKRRRAAAIGIVASGSSVGGLLWPLALHSLKLKVGFPWANRIIGFVYIPLMAFAVVAIKSREHELEHNRHNHNHNPHNNNLNTNNANSNILYNSQEINSSITRNSKDEKSTNKHIEDCNKNNITVNSDTNINNNNENLNTISLARNNSISSSDSNSSSNDEIEEVTSIRIDEIRESELFDEEAAVKSPNNLNRHHIHHHHHYLNSNSEKRNTFSDKAIIYEDTTTESQQGTNSIHHSFNKKHWIRRNLFHSQFLIDWSVCKDWHFILILAANAIGFFGLFTPLFFIPSYAQLIPNVSPQIRTYILTITNSGSVLGRVLPGFIGDKIGRLNMLIFAITASGIVVLALWLPAKSGEGLIIAAGFGYGMTSGALVSLAPATLGQLFGMRGLQSRLSIFFLVCSPGALLGPVICGSFLPTAAKSAALSKGVTDLFENNGQSNIQGYDKLIIFTGVMFLVSSAILIFTRFSINPKLFAFV